MSGTVETAGASTDIRVVVREKYGAIAEGKSCGCGCGCSLDDPSKAVEGSGASVLDQIGYTAEQKAAVPEGANLGLGCGSPLAYAHAKPGETVLDLGSGAGIDCFLAAREVGPHGHVIGVDMTSAMILIPCLSASRRAARSVASWAAAITSIWFAPASPARRA